MNQVVAKQMMFIKPLCQCGRVNPKQTINHFHTRGRTHISLINTTTRQNSWVVKNYSMRQFVAFWVEKAEPKKAPFQVPIHYIIGI